MHDSAPLPPLGFNFDALTRSRRRTATIALLVVALIVVAMTALRSTPPASPPGASTQDLSIATESSPSTTASVVVHVTGAVVRPGVVSLAVGSRIIDAIDAAGGATRHADPNQLGLAAKVVDGMRIYVPKRGESVPAADPNAGDGQGTVAAQGPINLNTASQSQLEALPGIGPSLAGEIISTRQRLGGFTSVDDLRRVHGIGDRRFEQLKALVTV